MSVATYYTDYWSSHGFQPLGSTPAPLARLFRRHLPPGCSCLDVGCGDGGTSGIWLGEHGYDYTGVDVSPTAIELARGRGLTARVIDDAAALPFPDADFETVVCIEVLEHLFDPQAAVREMLRVLKPGGILLVTTPNIAYWRRRLDLLCGRWNPYGDELAVEQPWRDPHIRFFTTRSLAGMLRQSGCEQVAVGGHAGAGLQHLPAIGHHLSRGAGWTYRQIERVCPALFSLRLHAVARKRSA
jgi:methionine biosynthesis protein MetW